LYNIGEKIELSIKWCSETNMLKGKPVAEAPPMTPPGEWQLPTNVEDDEEVVEHYEPLEETEKNVADDPLEPLEETEKNVADDPLEPLDETEKNIERRMKNRRARHRARERALLLALYSPVEKADAATQTDSSFSMVDTCTQTANHESVIAALEINKALASAASEFVKWAEDE